MKSRRKVPRNGIALFILLTAIIILSLLMKELLQATSSQANRVRNSYDRLQALYLARSAVHLSRFFLIFDQSIDKQLKKGETSDTLSEFWASPVPFPVPVELVQEKTEELTGSQVPTLDEDIYKKCEEFFSDFPGQAVSQASDLSALLNLNDLDEPSRNVFESFVALLTPNVDFLQSLHDRRMEPETLVRQMRDYADRNQEEEETRTSEDLAYSASQLDYRPKNRPYNVVDELKLIPSMDDELFEYLEPLVSAVYIVNRTKPAKINLNTVGKAVFQSLLKNVSNPEELATEFLEDRTKNETVYTDENAERLLKELFELDGDKIRLGLVRGTSDAFKIITTSAVHHTELQLETIVSRNAATGTVQAPIVLWRITP